MALTSQYHTSPDTGITVPIMTLGEDLQQLSLNNKARDNPVNEAVRKGKAPTLLDVKKSVKALLKTLIHATTQMDVLPKRRYATFKLYYTDKTPADYEPPLFLAGDQERDKWYFMTHDLDEMPDKWSIGRVNTGHHSVNLSVTSIATYLPSSNSLTNATSGGTISRSGASTLTPAQEASLRAAQVEQQITDARARRVAWSGEEAVELDDADGEGDDDPDYIRLPDGSYRKRTENDTPGEMMPSGIRNEETGQIEPLCGPMDIEEAHFEGVAENIPTKLDELNREKASEMSNVEQTQVVEDPYTQDVPMPSPSPENQTSTSNITSDHVFQSSGREADWSSPPSSPITSILSRQVSDTDMDVIKDLESQAVADDMVPLDLETQMEPIESFGSQLEQSGEGDVIDPRSTTNVGPDNGLECDCGVEVHGFHRLSPRSILTSVVRRSIKIVEGFKGVFVTADLTKANGTHKLEHKYHRCFQAKHLLRHLPRFLSQRHPEFVIQQVTALDDLGFPQVGDAKAKGNAKVNKQSKGRKNVQPKSYIFNRKAREGTRYADYFNPDPAVESRLLKIKELTSRTIKPNEKSSGSGTSSVVSPQPEIAGQETQTQAETQVVPLKSALLKRDRRVDDDGTPKPKKKVKISITQGLDLAE
ncbi:hypothetical protein H0H93_012282 [Arthromyces matolae]|nr:hypothetical protein H0H93_012282 [Arthromyces matolae]